MTDTIYKIVDTKTGEVVKTYYNKIRAHNMRDKLDNQYGGYRYAIKISEK